MRLRQTYFFAQMQIWIFSLCLSLRAFGAGTHVSADPGIQCKFPLIYSIVSIILHRKAKTRFENTYNRLLDSESLFVFSFMFAVTKEILFYLSFERK